jgi:DNA-binding beta-propeller fold protein YncE
MNFYILFRLTSAWGFTLQRRIPQPPENSMPPSLILVTGGALLAAALTAGAASTAGGTKAAGTLRQLSGTVVPGYTGELDRFDADVKGNRLFLAAKDRGTLEVFELSSGKHLKSVRGFDTPHKTLYLADRKRIVVIDSGAARSKMIDSTSFKILDTIQLPPGAEEMAYDASGRMMYVASGGKRGNMATSFMSKINPRTGQQLGTLAFDTDQLEAVAVEQNGPRLYVNVTGRNYVAVINKRSFSIIDKWTVTGAQANASMALDEAGHRLFVVTRQPARVVVIDTASGYTIDAFDAPGGRNEIVFDSKSRRLYLTSHNGISVFHQVASGRFAELDRVPTARGAGAAIFVPELNRMFVAQSAGEDGDGAALLSFDVIPGTAGDAVAAK